MGREKYVFLIFTAAIAATLALAPMGYAGGLDPDNLDPFFDKIEREKPVVDLEYFRKRRTQTLCNAYLDSAIEEAEAMEAYLRGSAHTDIRNPLDGVELAIGELTYLHTQKNVPPQLENRLERLALELLERAADEMSGAVVGLTTKKSWTTSDNQHAEYLKDQIRKIKEIRRYESDMTDTVWSELLVERSKRFPDLSPRLSAAFDRVEKSERFLKVFEDEVHRKPDTVLSPQQRATLRDIPLQPGLVDLASRINTATAAMERGNHAFAQRLLSDLKEVFWNYNLQLEQFKNGSWKGIDSIDNVYKKERGARLEKISRLEADHLLTEIGELLRKSR